VERDYLMPYTPETWVDDDGSGTVGTLVTADRMNNIEGGIDDAHEAIDSLVLQDELIVTAASGDNLPSATKTGNVITASANGALGVISGVNMILGDLMLVTRNLPTGMTWNGVYEVTNAGSVSTPWTLTRVVDWEDGDVVPVGRAVTVALGDYAGIWMVSGAARTATINNVLPFLKIGPPRQDGWTDIALNGSSNWIAQSSRLRPQYMKDTVGNVHLRGLVKPSSGTLNLFTTAEGFTLPAGYRPTVNAGESAMEHYLICGGYTGSAYVTCFPFIRQDGRFGLESPNTIGTSGYISLSGLSWPTS
jgi:hypothetical protein